MAESPVDVSTATVTFQPQARTINVPRGTTLYDATRMAVLPLGCSCDGQAICGWCKVEVIDGADHLSPMSEPERKLLRVMGSDPSERVACMAKVQGAVTITASYW